MSFQVPVGKQREFCLGSDARVNIAHGAVRSAKTVGANVRWLRAVLEAPEGANLLMTGKTLTSLERNVLLPISRLVGAGDFDYRRSLKTAYIYGRPILCEGANDESAFTKIAGLTLGGALVDEGSLIPESFFNMLISRLSEPGSQLFLTTNPAGPGHYLRKKWLDREDELDLKSWHFELTDNPWLDPAYVAELKRQFGPPSSLFYQRYIKGEWVMAEGAVFPHFNRDLHVVRSPPPGAMEALVVGIDYGQTHPTAFVKVGKWGASWFVFGEYRESDRTNARLSSDLQTFLSNKFPSAILVDPSAKSLINQLRSDGIQRARGADNSVLDSIGRISSALSTGALKITAACPRLIEEIEGYRWDPKATARGEDKPIKEADDLIDA
ncbi:MAG: PBSX family phage terminase large subunit, partial [Euryarchaeota archaeon]|nr:PBSX family phage terminase large subunit [Euryarchaeota archaeon]